MVGVAGNHWDGFSKGRNLHTNQVGLYPSFKVRHTDTLNGSDFYLLIQYKVRTGHWTDSLTHSFYEALPDIRPPSTLRVYLNESS